MGSVLNEDGSVTTPEGFKEAYRKFVDAGWPGVHLPEMAGCRCDLTPTVEPPDNPPPVRLFARSEP